MNIANPPATDPIAILLKYSPGAVGSVAGAFFGGASIFSQRGAMIIVPAFGATYLIQQATGEGIARKVMASTQSFLAVYVTSFAVPIVAGGAVAYGLTKVL